MSCFPLSVDLSCYYYQLSGLFHFLHFCSSLQKFATQVAAHYILAYISPNTLFALVPFCPITNLTSQNKAREQSQCIIANIVNTKYKHFSILPCMTPAQFDLERNVFHVISKFQGHNLTFMPLL